MKKIMEKIIEKRIIEIYGNNYSELDVPTYMRQEEEKEKEEEEEEDDEEEDDEDEDEDAEADIF